MEQLCLNGRIPSSAHLEVGVFPRLLYRKSLTVGKEEAKSQVTSAFFPLQVVVEVVCAA